MSAWMYINGLLHEQSRDTWTACILTVWFITNIEPKRGNNSIQDGQHRKWCIVKNKTTHKKQINKTTRYYTTMHSGT